MMILIIAYVARADVVCTVVQAEMVVPDANSNDSLHECIALSGINYFNRSLLQRIRQDVGRA